MHACACSRMQSLPQNSDPKSPNKRCLYSRVTTCFERRKKAQSCKDVHCPSKSPETFSLPTHAPDTVEPCHLAICLCSDRRQRILLSMFSAKRALRAAHSSLCGQQSALQLTRRPFSHLFHVAVIEAQDQGAMHAQGGVHAWAARQAPRE